MVANEQDLAFLGRIYDLFLTLPITAAFREASGGPEDEPHPQDPEMVVAIQADRFDLMSQIRQMRQGMQLELLAANDAAPAATWKTVARDGWPTCDGYTVYIGINTAGYACCFNQLDAKTCLMQTAEGTYRQMSGLRDWRPLDRPPISAGAAGVSVGEKQDTCTKPSACGTPRDR